MSSAALITSTPVTKPTNSTTYLRNRPRFMRGPGAGRRGAGEASIRSIVAYAASFDHLVGLNQDGSGHGDAERPRRTEVQHQLEHRGLLDRQVPRLGPAQHLVEQAAGPAEHVGGVGRQRR